AEDGIRDKLVTGVQTCALPISGSMIPTLLVGDLILVNKFHYGVRLPVINKKIIGNHEPQRGDVMVFRYPRDTSVDYIKRVVGVRSEERRVGKEWRAWGMQRR